jgi:drug/metabolite transporter (DMT)-like permease
MTAVLLALLSACAFAVSTVAQHGAAAAVPAGGHPSGLRWLAGLLRHRAWLCGQASAAAGFALHAYALRLGRVVIVQPVLSSGLVLTLGLGALLARRLPAGARPDAGSWLAAGVVAAGLCAFLLSAHPSGGSGHARPELLVGAVGGALLAVAAAAGWSRRPGRAHRALALGIAAGCGFGVTGLLLKQVVAPGPWTAAGWPAAALLVVGAASIGCAQYAYRAGSLIESLPALTVLEPLTAVLLAGPVFGERLAAAPTSVLGQLLGLVALTTGVVVLARRSGAARLLA